MNVCGGSGAIAVSVAGGNLSLFTCSFQFLVFYLKFRIFFLIFFFCVHLDLLHRQLFLPLQCAWIDSVGELCAQAYACGCVWMLDLEVRKHAWIYICMYVCVFLVWSDGAITANIKAFAYIYTHTHTHKGIQYHMYSYMHIYRAEIALGELIGFLSELKRYLR